MLGLLIGRYRVVDAATDWLVNALYATPLVAVIPLVILWLGLGDLTKLFIVTILAVFPVLINTAAGVRNVPQALIDVSTAFAANERQVFMKIILPSAVPYMMTGLRLGIGRAIIGMVVAEFFTAITGLGALIVKVRQPVRHRLDVRADPGADDARDPADVAGAARRGALRAVANDGRLTQGTRHKTEGRRQKRRQKAEE